MWNKVSALGWGKLAVCLILIFSLFDRVAFSGEAESLHSSLKNIQEYSKNAYLGMAYDEVQTILGKPAQKKELSPDKEGLIVGVWKLENYSLSASFDQKQKQMISLNLHWVGSKSSIPSYESILKLDFKVEEKRGTKIVHIEDGGLVLHWEIKPIPGDKDKFISVLSVMKK